MSRKERIDKLKQSLQAKAQKRLNAKPRPLSVTEIWTIYKSAMSNRGWTVNFGLTKSKVSVYCRNIKKYFNGDREKVKAYLSYCVQHWEDLQSAKFTKVSEKVPFAFIATASVISTIEKYMNGETVKRTKVSDRGNYDDREGAWVETTDEMKVYEKALEQGITLKTREEYEEYIKK